ncbi:ZIP Zinc transporter [Popillia japonica]|uniref:ZIP Zinc transporter n=1 Tax=Popillia japonica TaxID=7064 RepID=A0AAW1MEE9_POPJA
MNLIEAKITAMIALGLGSLVMGLLPILLTRFSRNNHPLFLSTLLCFGAGVLLSTSMVHMLPEIRESLATFTDYAELFFCGGFFILYFIAFTDYAELFFCGGFFILYFIDEMVHLFKSQQQHEEATQNEHKPLLQNPRRHSTGACNSYGARDETQLLQHAYNPNYHSRHDSFMEATPSTSCSDHHTSNITPHNPSQLCHIGHHPPCRTTNTSSLSLIVALTVHAILEGLAVGLEDSTSQNYRHQILRHHASILLLVGFCLGAELSSSNTTTPCQYFTAIIMFSFGSVVGIVAGLSITDLNKTLPGLLIPVLQAFAGGTLLYITVSEVLPRERAQWHQVHEKRTAGIFQFIAVGIGFTVMSVLIKVLHD